MDSKLDDCRGYLRLFKRSIGTPKALALLLVLLFTLLLAFSLWFLENRNFNNRRNAQDHLLQKTTSTNPLSRMQRAVDKQSITESESINLKKRVKDGLPDLDAVLQSTQSYRGTKPDGFYPVDDQGELVNSMMVMRRFRYWLMASGELGDPDILDIIRQDIHENLVSPAKDQALELLGRYLGFLQSMQQQLASLKGQGMVLELSPMERFQWIQAEHQRWFSTEEIDVFFSKDYQATQTQLALMAERNSRQAFKSTSQQARLTENKDKQLKEDALAEVDKHPGWLLAAQQSLMLQQAKDTHGATMDEATRQRLHTLIKNRQLWLGRIERYQDYYLEWRRLGQSQERLKEYERQHFSEQEQRRLAAYR